MTTWFTSDLHFKHKNICSYTNRNKDTTTEEHDEWLIDLWNSQVKKSDLVWHLGDFCFAAGYETVKGIVNRLNGQKHFLIGNHDKEENFKRLKEEGLLQFQGWYKEIKVKEEKSCLMHFPIASWHRQHYGAFMLHGHSHGSYKGQGRILDVGLDSAYNVFGEHKFFSEDEVHKLLIEKEVISVDGHRKGTK